MSDIPEKKKPPVRLVEGDLIDAEYARPVYVLTAKPDTQPADYLAPEAWVHVMGRKLKQGARLEITAEDASWYAEILVRVCDGQTVSLALLREHHFDSADATDTAVYEPRWAGPAGKWQVIRKSDRHVMIDKLQAKSEAFAWIEANPVKLAA